MRPDIPKVFEVDNIFISTGAITGLKTNKIELSTLPAKNSSDIYAQHDS
jgi:hypothetical protein